MIVTGKRVANQPKSKPKPTKQEIKHEGQVELSALSTQDLIEEARAHGIDLRTEEPINAIEYYTLPGEDDPGLREEDLPPDQEPQ